MPTNINFDKKLGITKGTGITLPTASSWEDTNSFVVDGTTDYIQGTSTYSELDGLTKATWSIWIKPIGTGIDIVYSNPRDTTSGNCQFLLWTWTGRLEFLITGTGNFLRGDASLLNWNVWNHVMVCVDFALANIDVARMFINGVDASTSNTIYLLSSFPNASGELFIAEDANSYRNPFEGNLDEFAIWAGTDERANLAEIYNAGIPNDLSSLPTAPAPTTWLRMGENATWIGGSYYQLVDEMGTGYKLNTRNMALASKTTDVPPTFDVYSTLFDGISDNVSMGNVLNMADNGTDAYSISLWFKTTSLATQNLIGKSSTSANGYNLYMNGGTFFILLGTYAANGILGGVSGGSSVYDGNWHHVCLTYDGSQDISGFSFYYDDVSKSISTYSNNTPSGVSTSNDFMIGARGTASVPSLEFDGNIDEASFFNTELSSSDVTTIYNSGVPNDISTLSPLGWWRMGDGDTHPTITDHGSGSNDGTMNNMSSANFVTDVPT